MDDPGMTITYKVREKEESIIAELDGKPFLRFTPILTHGGSVITLLVEPINDGGKP
jgi:hypothetical protein